MNVAAERAAPASPRPRVGLRRSLLVLLGLVAVAAVVLEARLPAVHFGEIRPRGLAGRPLDWKSMEAGGEVVRLDPAEAAAGRTVDLPDGVSVRMISLSIHGPVRGFWMDTDSSIDFGSLAAAVAEVTAGATTDRQRAEALWKFVMDTNIHGPRPLEAAYGNFSPPHHLTSYGYSMCGNATSTLAYLWELSGLPARTWSLRGHVVPEVFYDGGWHLYDADERRVFVSPVDGSILGIEDLQKDPELVRLALDPHGRGSHGENLTALQLLYTQRAEVDYFYRVRDSVWEDGDLSRLLSSPRYVLDLYRYARLHRSRPLSMGIALDLGPEEELHLFWKGEDLRYALGAPESVYEDRGESEIRRPARHGNGALVWRPRTADGARMAGIEADGGILRLRPGVDEGRLEWDVRSPFLITDAALSGSLAGPGAGFRVDVRGPDAGWSAVGEDVLDPGKFTVDLQPINAMDRPQVRYAYSFALTLRRGPGPGPAELRDLALQTDVQVNPAALPRLTAGSNRVTFRGDVGSPDAFVELRWADDPSSLAALTPSGPDPGTPCFTIDPDLLGDEPEEQAAWSVTASENLAPRINSRLSYLTTVDPTAAARLEWTVRPPAGVREIRVVTSAQIDRPDQTLTLSLQSGPGDPWRPVWRKTDSPYPESFPENTTDISGLVAPGRPFRLRWDLAGSTVLRREARLVRVQVRGFCGEGDRPKGDRG